MKRLLLILGLIFIVNNLHAKAGYISPKMAQDATYAVKQGTVTDTGGTFSFPGYVTVMDFYVKGATVIFSGDFMVGNSSSALGPNEELYMEFEVPTSSPAIFYYQVQAGGILRYTVGGLKTDQ